MKKLFTLDDLFLALIGAVGYGLSFEIPKILAYPEWLCIVICLVVGTIIEGVSQKIVFSKFIQNNHRLMAFATLSVIFVIALYIAEKIIDISITNYVVEQIQFVILPPIIFFAVKLAIRWYRVKKFANVTATAAKVLWLTM